jgi:hypothetical protein
MWRGLVGDVALFFAMTFPMHEASLPDAFFSSPAPRHFMTGYDEWPRWGQEYQRARSLKFRVKGDMT